MYTFLLMQFYFFMLSLLSPYCHLLIFFSFLVDPANTAKEGLKEDVCEGDEGRSAQYLARLALHHDLLGAGVDVHRHRRLRPLIDVRH